MDMKRIIITVSRPYAAPACRVWALVQEHDFLASDGFGPGGYPGDDLDPGDEFNW